SSGPIGWVAPWPGSEDVSRHTPPSGWCEAPAYAIIKPNGPQRAAEYPQGPRFCKRICGSAEWFFKNDAQQVRPLLDSEVEQAGFSPPRAPSFGPAGCLIAMDSSPDL